MLKCLYIFLSHTCTTPVVSAAKAYGDQTFSKLMYVKILAPFLPMMSGYNVLFQDVDVVWHENPLPYFLDKSLSGNFDAYFEVRLTIVCLGSFLFVSFWGNFSHPILSV